MPEALATRSLRELTRVVFSHLLGMIVIVALITGGTYFACQQADPIYESSVTVLVKQPKRASSTIQEVSPDRSLEVFIKTQQQLILSDVVLSRTMVLVENEELRTAWQQQRDKLWEVAPSKRDELRDELDLLYAKIDVLASQIALKRQEDLRDFREAVEVETPGGETVGMTEVFTITVRQRDKGSYTDGSQARTSADVLAGCYIDRYWQVQAESYEHAADLVQARLSDLKENMLNRAEEALTKFLDKEFPGDETQAKTPTTQASSVLNAADVVILEQLLKSGTEAGAQIVRTRFEQEKIRLGTELASLQALQRQIAKQLDDETLRRLLTRKHIDELEKRAIDLIDPVRQDPQADAKRQAELTKIAEQLYDLTDQPRIVVPQEVLRDNDIVNKMKTELADLIIARNKLRGQFAPTYRELVDLYVEICRAKLEIIEEMRAEKQALDVRIETIRAQLAQVAEQIEVLTAKLDAIAKLLPEYDRLKAEVRMARDNYASMEAELLQAEADEQRSRKEVTIQVIDRASIPDPDRPAIPNTPVYTIVAAVVSLLMSLAYAFLADHFDHTLRSIHEVERYLGTSVIGSVRKSGRSLVS